jgi:cytochrome P450
VEASICRKLITSLAEADTTLGPYAVAKNTLGFASPYAMHRLAQYFPEPERYEPHRFTPEREAALPRYAYFPFGGGLHIWG